MAKGPRYKIKFHRRKKLKTDYRKRIALLKSNKIRAVVRKSLYATTVQFVEYNQVGDKVIITKTSRALKQFDWHKYSNTTAAYLTGYFAAKNALEKGINEAVLDIGLHSPVKGCKVFAALKGICDAGIKVPHSPDILPSDERLKQFDPDNKLETVIKKIDEYFSTSSKKE
jgi:large subunit ribosomal protein L18